MEAHLCRRQFLAAAVAGAVVAACEGPRTPLSIGLTSWPANDLYFLAERRGYYGNVPVRIVDFAAADQGLQAFRNGVVDLMPCTLDEALLLRGAVADLRVVQVLDDSYGADVILALPTVQTLADLRGLRIGYEASALGAYVLSRGLELAGLTPADVVPVHVAIDEHERAFREGRVQALVTYEPVRSRLLAEGARVLFDSTRIPGEIVDVLVATEATLARDAPGVEAVVRGWLLAARELRTEPDRASETLATRMGLPSGKVAAAFSGIRLVGLDGNRRLLQGEPPPLARTAERLSRTMLETHLIGSPPDLSALFDARIVTGLSLAAAD